MFGLDRIGGGGYDSPQCSTKSVELMRPRTLTEQLDDQIAHHKARIALLEDAKAAMTPDVAKALDALQKLS